MLSRCATITTGVAVVLGIMALALSPTAKSGPTQAGGDKAAAQPVDRGDGKKPAAPKKAIQILEERVDVAKYEGPLTLRDALEILQRDLAGRGMELDIIVDTDVFKEENPEAPDIYDTQVKLPPLPRKLTVAMLLRQMLNKVPTGNATYLVFRDHVLVTTMARSGIESLLLQHVTGIYDNRPLGQLLRDLGEKTAVTIVVDPRVGDKETKPISVTFQRDATLAGALRVITEMADLKVTVLDGIVYVTTPAHAEQLRKEQTQLQKDRHVLWSVSEFLNPRPPDATLGGIGMPGIGPGFPPSPGGIAVPDVMAPREMPTPLDAPPGFARRREAAANS
jgi:hypothetical protein